MNHRIQSIELFPVVYPVAGHFKFFEGTAGRPAGRPSVLIKITAENGAIGWGESVPSPRWSYETIESVVTTIEHHLAPELTGRDPFDTDEVHAAMNRTIAPSFSTGQPICKAGVDLALFDLTGRLLGKSAAARWGRNDRATVPLSWTLNPRSLAEVETLVAQAHSRGYRHFNIKVGPDPARDTELLRTIRRLAPGAGLWADANGGYSEADALAIAPRLADLGVEFFEQPVPANRLGAFARLKRLGALPIILDEGIVSVVELEEFHRLKLLDGVAIKIARVGGLTEARRQVKFLEDNGLIFLGSGLTDPDVSLAASLALFAAHGLQVPAALNGPQFLTASVVKQPFVPVNGELKPTGGAGLGIEVDESKLRDLLVKPA